MQVLNLIAAFCLVSWALWAREGTEFTLKGSFESYTKEKTYSTNGFNLLLSEKEENGLYTEYAYLPGTNCLISKKVFDGDQVLSSTLYEYDSFKIVTKQTVDDGVTVRVTRITPRYCAPGFGQPQSIQEFYLKDGAEILLGRRDFVYGQNDLVIQEDFYDANNSYCYSFYTKYDAHDHVIEIKDPLGRRTIYEYDANDNKIVEEVVGSGLKTYFTYDLCNQLIAQEDVHEGYSFNTYIERDLLGRKTQVTNPYGLVTKYSYDALGREIRQEYLGAFESKEYSIFDDVCCITDREGHKTRLEHNCNGRTTKIIYPDDSIERFEYTLNGLLAKKWEKSGACITYTYDVLGRVLEEKSPGFYTIRNEYSGMNLVRTYDKMGHCTEYEYDGAGRKIAEIKCGKQKTSYFYDPLGRLYKTIDNDCAYIQEFDVLNRVIEERTEDTLGSIFAKTTFAYDINDNKSQIVVYASPTIKSETKYLYNSRGELIQKIDALGHQTEIRHYYPTLTEETLDSLGNTVTVTFDQEQHVISRENKDTSGQRTAYVEYVFDKMGREVSQRHAVIVECVAKSDYTIESAYDSMGRIISLREMGKETRYIYDGAGYLQTLVKPDGIRLHYTYDLFGHLVAHSSSDGTIDYAYDYDLNGNLIQVIDHHEETSAYAYDELDQLIMERLANGHVMRYAYDAMGRMVQTFLPDGSSIQYVYNGVDLLEVRRGAYVHKYLAYDWESRPLRVQLIGCAGTLSFEYDLLGRQTALTSEHFSETIPVGGFDAAGNLLTLDLADPAGHFSKIFAYDALYRLTKENDYSFIYDSTGNRRYKNNDAYEVTVFNQVASTATNNYTYDKNGNLSSDRGNTYIYDALDRLTAFNDTVYTYDHSGRRMSKNGETFFYQKSCEIGSYDASNHLTLRILGKGRAMEVGASIAIETGGEIYAPIHDHRGNICLILTLTGMPAQTIRYTAFGESIFYGSDITPWQFASKRLDPESDLIYFSNRYYLPHLGRWLTPDPK